MIKPKIRSQKRIILATLVIFITVAIGIGSWLYLNQQRDYQGKIESLKIVYPKFESLALFWIAEDQGFFIKNGLNVTSQAYASGAEAIGVVVKGEADVAVGISEFPLTVRALQKESLRAFTSIDKSEFIYLVCRRDRGINSVSDLAGKRIGTVSGTIADFYLGRFLELHGMSLQNITLVDLRTPEEWVNAIVDGDVDAISIAQPSVNLINERLGENSIVFPVQSSQLTYSLVISTKDWINNHSELIPRFLNALLQAEEYARIHQAEARVLIKERMNFTDEYMEIMWKQNLFSLSLDQSLILSMEDEARWMILNGLTDKREIPNFLDNIYEDALKVLRAESVNIIR